VCFGTLKTKHISRFSDLTLRETTALAAMILPMALLGLVAGPVLELIHVYVENLIGATTIAIAAVPA